MPLPTYVSSDTLDRADEMDLSDQAEEGISSIRLPHLVEQGIRSIRQAAFGSPTATTWTPTKPPDPLPVVLTQSPQPIEYSPTVTSGDIERRDSRASTTSSPAGFATMPSAASGVPSAMPSGVSGPAPAAGGDLHAYARAAAQRYGVDPDIFERQIGQESGFRPDAVSPAGAKGIAQFMPGTAASYGVNVDDPYSSLDGAARHMADNLKRNGGDYARALAAYNAGQGAVDEHNGVPPYAETQQYIRAILGGASPTAAAPTAAGSPSSAPAAAAPAQPSAAGAPMPQGSGPIHVRDQWGNEWNTTQDALNRRPGGSADLTIIPSPTMQKTGADMPDDTGPSAGDQKRQKMAAASGQDAQPQRNQAVAAWPNDLEESRAKGETGEGTYSDGTPRNTAVAGQTNEMTEQADGHIKPSPSGATARDGYPFRRDPWFQDTSRTPSPRVSDGLEYRQPLQPTMGDTTTGQEQASSYNDPTDTGTLSQPLPMRQDVTPDVTVGDTSSPSLDPGGAQFAAQDSMSQPAQPTMLPVWDANGNKIGYRQEEAAPASDPTISDPNYTQPAGRRYDPNDPATGVNPTASGALRPTDLSPEMQGARPWLPATNPPGQFQGVDVDSLVPRAAQTGPDPYSQPEPGRWDRSTAPPDLDAPSAHSPAPSGPARRVVSPYQTGSGNALAGVETSPSDAQILQGQGAIARGLDAGLQRQGVVDQHPETLVSPENRQAFMNPQRAATPVGLADWRDRLTVGSADAIARGLGQEPENVLVTVTVGGQSHRMTVSDLLQNITDPLFIPGAGVGDIVLDGVGHKALTLAAPYIKGAAQAVVRRILEAAPAVKSGVEAVGRGIRGAIDANAERVAQADARAAEQGSTVAPGTLGVVSGNPLEANTAAGSRVIPPDVSDTLDFPVRVPTDPVVVRAIEAAGGSVDPNRGVNLNVIRMQGPEAAGKPATRSSTFYTADKPGTRSPYEGAAGSQTGGNERIEAPTTYRSPLVLNDPPGDNQGFDAAMNQMDVTAPRPPSQIAGFETRLRDAERQLADVKARGADGAAYLPAAEQYVQFARAQLEAARTNGISFTAAEIDRGIETARRAGPPGSPKRAQALKDLVNRYGGDDSVIDDLVSLRGGDDTESAWAIKENILAHNARAKGYDGVLTVQQAMSPSEYSKAVEAAIQAHPDYQAAGDAATAAYAKYKNARGPRKADLYADWQDATDKVAKVHDRLADTVDVPVSHKITELADFRESHNPTPATQGPEWAAAHGKVESLGARLEVVSQAADDAERVGDDTALRYAMKEYNSVRREYDAAVTARESLRGTAPGYTLRSDIPRRGGQTTASATAGVAPQSASPDRLATVNRALGQGVMSAVSGGASAAAADQLGDPNDPNRQAKAFVAGAVAPVLGAKGVAALVRRFGPRAEGLGEAALATLGNVPNNPQGTQIARNVARQAARTGPSVVNGQVVAASSKPANLIDVLQGYRHSVGMLGNIGTGLVNAMGGPVSIGSGLATDVVRTGILKGYPVPAIMEAGSLVTGIGEAAKAALSTAMGRIDPAVRAAPDFRPPLAERMSGAAGKAAGYAIETPGRLFTQTPDAFFGTLFSHWGERRAANEIMMENGVSRLDPAAQVQEVQRLLNNPTPDETKKIAEGAKKFSDEMTYKGKAGYWEDVFSRPWRPSGGRPANSNDTTARQIHDLVGSFVMPFYGSIFKIHKLAATHIPLVGSAADTSLPGSEKIARQLVGLGFGIYAADLAAKGLTTGPGPDDPDEKARLKATGWDEWSTYIPGIGYTKTDNLAQAAPTLKAVAAYYDAKRYGSPSETDGLKQGNAVVKNILGAFSNFPAVQAAQAVFKMGSNPIEGAADLGTTIASSFVPAMVRAKEASDDPYQRTVDPNAPMGEQIKQRALNRLGSVPGVGSRQDSPPALNRETGDPMPNPRQGIGAFIPQQRQVKDDPLMAELSQYGVNLDQARSSFTITATGSDAADTAPGAREITLTPPMRQEWLRYRRESIDQAAPQLKANADYQKAPDTLKQRMWRSVVASAEKYADGMFKANDQNRWQQMVTTAPEKPVKKAS